MKKMSKVLSVLLVVCMVAALVPSVLAANLDLPSLYQTYKNYFMFGTFGGYSNTFQLHHYQINSPANNMKLDNQIGSNNTNSASRQDYVAAVNAINANTELSVEEKAAAIDAANKTVKLSPTTSGYAPGSAVVGWINDIRIRNASRPADEKIYMRGHTMAWHGGQQPNYFFCDGFTYSASNPQWTTREVMLARLDSYINQLMEYYAPYKDVLIAWDVVNEPIDDFTGFIRNEQDYQPGQWGRIFKRLDIADRNERLYEESEWVRQAFASARKWSNFYAPDWDLKLYVNDFMDSNKPYQPKLDATVQIMKPIYAAGNVDGWGMQGRLASTFPSIELFAENFYKGLTVADEVSFTEADIRSDYIPNPAYDPSKPTYQQANGGTCINPVSIIRPEFDGKTNTEKTNASVLPAIANEQADYSADLFDFLLENHEKIVCYSMDNTNDSNTFNSYKGAHLFSGQSGNPEKPSYFAVIGAKWRYELKNLLAGLPDDTKASAYTSESWGAYASARAAAEAILKVRIYDMAAVTNVQNATDALKAAYEALAANTAYVDIAVSSPVDVIVAGCEAKISASAVLGDGLEAEKAALKLVDAAGAVVGEIAGVSGKFTVAADAAAAGDYKIKAFYDGVDTGNYYKVSCVALPAGIWTPTVTDTATGSVVRGAGSPGAIAEPAQFTRIDKGFVITFASPMDLRNATVTVNGVAVPAEDTTAWATLDEGKAIDNWNSFDQWQSNIITVRTERAGPVVVTGVRFPLFPSYTFTFTL